MPPNRLLSSRLLLIVTVCLALAGCQLWPFNRQDTSAEPSTRTPPGGESSRPTPAADSNERAVSLLQEGSEQAAEAMLVRIIDQRPDDATARLLLAQIRQPPEELLGERYEQITVEPGDSLSAIAGRTLNNELLFYALARINDIELPRLLRPGQQLTVPRIEAPEPAEVTMEPPPAEPEAPESDASGGNNTQLAGTAKRLVERERDSQAYALLLSAARAGKLEASSGELLAETAVRLAREACEDDDPERARKVLNQASPWLGGAAERGAFARQRRHVEARIALGKAEKRLADDDYNGAFEALMNARELADDLSEMHGDHATRIVEALAMHYHDRALSAWRDQKVDESVTLWERVLRIDPAFEPAVRYLDRAHRIRRRLDNLEKG